MSHSAPRPAALSLSTQEGRNALIASLREPPHIGGLSYLALKTVTAIRLLALCARTGQDPLGELTRRFGCVTTAKHFLAFADLAGTYWPESVRVLRPCCRALSPDEATLGQMSDAAAAGDRARFARVLDGFVRADRHDALFDRAAAMVAAIQ